MCDADTVPDWALAPRAAAGPRGLRAAGVLLPRRPSLLPRHPHGDTAAAEPRPPGIVQYLLFHLLIDITS